MATRPLDPDDLFRRADEPADRLGKSRSEPEIALADVVADVIAIAIRM